MIISILHPSRGRPIKCFETAEKWISSAGVEVEYNLSLDFNDPALKDYRTAFDYHQTFHKNWKCVVSNNDCVVKAVNKCAEMATGDVLVYISDDVYSQSNWGEEIERLANFYENEVWVIKVNDGHQKFLAPILTFPVMSRALYTKLGYFFNPIYRNQWVDNDLFQVCNRMGVIKNHPELQWDHRHPDADSSVLWDKIYERGSNKVASDYGRLLFEERVKNRFQ